MKRIDMIHTFAGFVVILSVVLTLLVNTNWVYLALFVGLNLFQFGFTKFCPLNIILKKLGIKD